LNLPKKGINISNMGINDLPTTGLADALFSRVQQRVLSLLFGQPGRIFRDRTDPPGGLRHRRSAAGTSAAGRQRSGVGNAGGQPETLLRQQRLAHLQRAARLGGHDLEG
jgi:hypothetical protein